MAAARVILVSDTHLSAAAPQAQANWDAVVSYAGACAPDLVIHLGDLSLDEARDAMDLRYGRAQLDRLPAPWHAVPGNHDVGDNPSPGTPAGIAVDAGRRQRWLEVVGAAHPDHRPARPLPQLTSHAVKQYPADPLCTPGAVARPSGG